MIIKSKLAITNFNLSKFFECIYIYIGAVRKVGGGRAEAGGRDEWGGRCV